MVDTQGMLTVWNLMDTMNEIKSERLEALMLDDRYRDKVKNIDLKLYSNAQLGEDLLVESNFAPNGKKQVDLKVYVSKRAKGEPARRVCKAVYTLAIEAKQYGEWARFDVSVCGYMCFCMVFHPPAAIAAHRTYNEYDLCLP